MGFRFFRRINPQWGYPLYPFTFLGGRIHPLSPLIWLVLIIFYLRGEVILQAFICIAVGTLVGDSFIHLGKSSNSLY